jgi:hypothetical protein
MQLVLNSEYTLKVTSEELRIIGLCLCGRVREDQEEQAEGLNKKLLKQIHLVHQQRARLAENALESVSDGESIIYEQGYQDEPRR